MGQKQRARYGIQRGSEPTEASQQPQKSIMETVAAATETNELDWISKIIIDMEQNLQSEKNDIDIIAAKSDEVLESIDEAYDEDSTNELSEEELRQAILNGKSQHR